MIESDKEKFKQLLMVTGELHSKSISKTLAVMYWSLLKDYDIEAVDFAFTNHLRVSSFFPKPADLLKQIDSNSGDNFTVSQRAELAWAQIIHYLEKYGPYRDLKLEDTQAVAALKGTCSWAEMATLTYKELDWKKKEFLKVYDSYENVSLENMPKMLPGIANLQNAKLTSKKNLGGILSQLQEKLKPDQKKLNDK